MVGFLIGLANVLMVLTSLFLICLILIQRGKGGGLAGAFGGTGGSSAFGTKAGDVFTRVTIYVAIFWFFLALCLVWASNAAPKSAFSVTSENTGSSLDDPKVDPKVALPPVDGSADSKTPPPVVPKSSDTTPKAPEVAPKSNEKAPDAAPAEPDASKPK